MGKKGWGIGLAVLGVLCLVVAAVLAWVVVPNQKQLPADTNTTRHLTGTAKMLLNPAALASGNLSGALITNVPVKAERTVKVLATDGGSAQVSDARTLASGAGDPLGQSTAVYAVDRKNLGPAQNPPSSWQVVHQEGLTISWPIGAEKKDYTGWVNDTQGTTPLKYVREESKGGLNTYVYEAHVAAAPIKDDQVLAALPKALPASVLAGLAAALPIPDALKAQLAQLLPQLGDPINLSYTYQAEATYWVEPTTGVVVDTQREEIRNVGLALPTGGVLPAAPVFDVTTAYTPQSVSDAAQDAKDAKDKIQAYGSTWPLILLIVGLVAILAGLALVVTGRKPAAVGGSPSTS